MSILVVGLIVFLGVHTLTTMREARQAAINTLGAGGYKFLYSVVAFIGLALIVYGFGQYRASGMIPVWNPPNGMKHLAIPLVWIAFICVTAAYVPTGKIKTTLKHPMLVGVKTWALAHLLVNGDLGSIILFGALLAWAIYDRISCKRRGAGTLAIVSGFKAGDAMAIIIGTIAFGAMFMFHARLIGVSIM